MRLLTFFGFLVCIFSASASTEACRKYKLANPAYAQSQCQCDNFPTALRTPPSRFPGLELTAACDFQIRDSEPGVVGDFFFEGEQVVSGILRREPSDFVDEFTLLGEERSTWPQKPPVFFRSVVHLQFNDQRMAKKVFKAPKPSEKAPCWEARVKLKITAMQSVFGWDNREGDFPRKYTVLTVGPYRKCANPTPSAP